MRRLSLESCRPLALRILPRIRREGLVKPFRAWRPATTYLEAMQGGSEFPAALRRIGLPEPLEALQALGARRGVLDHVCEDIQVTYARRRTQPSILKDLSVLILKYRSRDPQVACMSEACFAREIEMLARRAKTEKAREVIVKADGEQVYLGVKPVRVRMEGLDRTRTALRARFGARGRTVCLDGWSVRVRFG